MKNEGSTGPVLPDGVSLADWALEKNRWQNPRIRAFLGCIRVLDEVFESNYAILHCSPKRLDQIWAEIRKITEIIKGEVAPLLKVESKIPDLEQARESANVYLEVLDRNLLRSIEKYPLKLDEKSHEDVRKLLCVAVGQLHAFLLDTLGEIIARDPRSHSDTDYFLTRKFARDVDEAEWLYTSVSRLEEYLQAFTHEGSKNLMAIGDNMAKNHQVPDQTEWQDVSDYLDIVSGELVGRLKMILGLRGIRLSELELLDRHASVLPSMCLSLRELFTSANSILESIEERLASEGHSVKMGFAVEITNAAIAERMLKMMREIHDQIRDLTTYLPVWRQCIENRRAMMLRGPEQSSKP